MAERHHPARVEAHRHARQRQFGQHDEHAIPAEQQAEHALRREMPAEHVERERAADDVQRIRGAELRKNQRSAERRDPQRVKGTVAPQARQRSAPRRPVRQPAQAVRQPRERDEAVEDRRQRIAREEPEQRVVREDAADGNAEREARIHRQPDGRVGAHPQRLRHDVRQQCADRGVIRPVCHARQRRADDHGRQRRRGVEQHEKRGRRKRAEHDRIAPAEMIREPAAQQSAAESAEPKRAHRPRRRDQRVALPREIDREERPHERPEPVDERPGKKDPERPRQSAEVGEQGCGLDGRGH